MKKRQAQKVADPSGDSVKRQYDSEKSKCDLTEAAKDVFSKKGFDGATTRAIAKKACLNESLIQRYFKNKLGLFFAVVNEYQKKISSDLPYEPQETLAEELLAFFRFRVNFAVKEKKLIKLVMINVITNKAVSDHMKSIMQNGMPTLLSRLQHFQARGLVRKDLDIKTVTTLVGTTSFAITTLTYVLGSLSEEHAQDVLRLSATVLAKGLS